MATMSKQEIAAALEEIGVLLEIKGENEFRCKSYHNAARALNQLPGDFHELMATGALGQTRGLGATMIEKITAMYNTGELEFLKELRSEIPPGVIDMLRIPGIGPKKVISFRQHLGVESIADLEKACLEGRVAGLKGFGLKTQQKILEGIAFLGQVGQRVLFNQAQPLGLRLLQQISQMDGVIRSELCGSLRRKRETAKDIDILVSSANPKPIMDAFVALPEVMQVVAHGETKSSVVAALASAGTKVVLNADLRIVPDISFACALHYFTGSKDHNIRMRSRALDRGLSLNEYALKKADGIIPCPEEKDIFAALDLDYIPPELREDTGEIEAAAEHRLPRLIETGEIRGVFHNHTTYSDGSASVEEMARAAQQLGFEYFGVGDHSQSLKVARGMSPERVRQQWQEIDAIQSRLPGIRILKGVEVDILEDGSLDYDDELLFQFDYVVASVHSHFNQTIEVMTRRICTAIAHPAVTMLGHATGRLLLQREAYRVDLDQVLSTAARHGTMIEINAHPVRLDLDWIHCKQAKKLGIPIVINPDAHAPAELALFQYGVYEARRGWLEKDDIFNTRTLPEIMHELQRRRQTRLERQKQLN